MDTMLARLHGTTHVAWLCARAQACSWACGAMVLSLAGHFKSRTAAPWMPLHGSHDVQPWAGLVEVTSDHSLC